MKMKRKIVHIDEERCNGCGQCVGACAEGAIELHNGKARLVAEKYCDGLAACLGKCPVDAIKIIERESDPFDPEAVERYLSVKKGTGGKTAENSDRHVTSPSTGSAVSSELPCDCPSTQVRVFSPACDHEHGSAGKTSRGSLLTHWPVQIRLVPPTAPFLKEADLLVASDCTAVACPGFHEELLKGKVVMMGCPKFDDTEEYIDRFTQIFTSAGIRSITVAVMEVPCCSKMPLIVKEAIKAAGKTIPTRVVVIGAKGNILSEKTLPA